MKEIVKSENAPVAIGPYSQAVKVSGKEMLFMSGQISLDPGSMKLVGDSAAEQCRQVMKNLAAVLEAAGGELSGIVKTTIFLADMNDFAAVNEVYGSFFTVDPPARATVEVSRLPKEAKVLIEAIAVL
jgi:2-iminobutanoate/2-iminopropanoate deaminase